MSDARRRAEEALARRDRCSDPECVACSQGMEIALRALLAAEPAKGACADCGGLGWIPAGDEQLGCIACNGNGTIEPAPPDGAEVRKAAERLETWTDPATGDQYAHGRCVGAPASAGIGEAAKIIRRIVTNHDARIAERGVLVYGRPSVSTGFVEAIEWLRRYDAALRGGQKGGE